MVGALVRLVWQSAALVVLVTAAFWAIAGGAVARHTGRHLRIGVVVGALAPLVGPVVLLLVRRPRDAAALVPAPTAVPASVPPVAANTWLPQQASPWTPAPTASGRAPQAVVAAPWLPAVAPAAPPSGPPHERKARPLVHALAVLLAEAGAVLMIASLTVPWLHVRVTVIVDEQLGAADTTILLALVLSAAGVLAASGLLAQVQSRCRWLVLGALASTVMLVIGLESLLFAARLADVVERLTPAVSSHAALKAAPGALLLALGGALGTAWAILTLSTGPQRCGRVEG